MIAFFKVVCLVGYALAIASLLGMLPESWHIIVPIVAVVLAAHVIEVFAIFKYVRSYKGSLAMSILLTVLFGVLHWKPIANSAKNSAA